MVAVFGFGSRERIEELRRVGGRAIGLGVVSFFFVAGLWLFGVSLVHGGGPSLGS